MTTMCAGTTSRGLRAGDLLPEEVFARIRRRMMLDCCKWDPQVGDVGTLAGFPVVMGAGEWRDLCRAAEALAAETLALERALARRPDLFAKLGIGRRLRRALANAPLNQENRLRAMRFDFHPTREGWKVSEVNSDVPGGYAEASAFPAMMAEHCADMIPAGNPGRAVAEEIAAIAETRPGKVALLTAEGFMEDHQVVGYLGRELMARGMECTRVLLKQLRNRAGKLWMESAWYCGPMAVLVRFYQGEWLSKGMERGSDWRGVLETSTAMLNPARAILSESKRLPLLWEELGVGMETWRRYLPETREPRDAPWERDEGWIVKTAYCNTGDSVTMRTRLSDRQWWKRRLDVRLNPRLWLAQRRFEATAIETPMGRMYPCMGVYVIGGKACGAYVRLSRGPVVDFEAVDAALLIEAEGDDGNVA